MRSRDEAGKDKGVLKLGFETALAHKSDAQPNRSPS